MTNQKKVEEFHLKHNVRIGNKNYSISAEEMDFRYRLISEELSEFGEEVEAIYNGEEDYTNACKELADILYVVYGTAVSMGIDLDKVFSAVHDSNMTKTVGNKRHDGKISKGKDYKLPDLSFLINVK